MPLSLIAALIRHKCGVIAALKCPKDAYMREVVFWNDSLAMAVFLPLNMIARIIQV
jgi:hypothetical protein